MTEPEDPTPVTVFAVKDAKFTATAALQEDNTRLDAASALVGISLSIDYAKPSLAAMTVLRGLTVTDAGSHP